MGYLYQFEDASQGRRGEIKDERERRSIGLKREEQTGHFRNALSAGSGKGLLKGFKLRIGVNRFALFLPALVVGRLGSDR